LFIFVFIIGVIVMLGWTLKFVLDSQVFSLQLQGARTSSYSISDDLLHRSQELTQAARMYVVTGDSAWDVRYQEELQDSSRNSVYAEFSEDYPDSLITKRIRGAQLALYHIVLSTYSDLRDKEFAAIHALQGLYQDSAGAFNIKRKPDPALARELLFSSDYLKLEAQLRANLRDFMSQVLMREKGTVQAHLLKGFSLLSNLLKLLIVGLVILILVYFVMKRRYDAQVRAERQLKAQNEDLQQAMVKAEESDRLKSAFLANMSHEIRTPMNGILGFASLLREQKLSGPEQREYLLMIEKSGARMLNIINNIVDISRIESGLMDISPGETDINQQMEFLYTFFRPEADRKGLKLAYRTSLPESRCVILTDREKLYSIMTNLIKNAMNYTLQGEVVYGYEFKEGTGPQGASELEFFVRDTGCGIPQDRQEAIFERFIQADITDKKANQGAGLGLSISKAYVGMLGGRIWVESCEDRGSCFRFTLPYHQVAQSIVSADALQDEELPPLPGALKILVAEDDDTSIALLPLMLKGVYSELLKARNGVEAVDLCRNNSDIDLILMDIAMPEMNGYEAVRQIRSFNKRVIIIAQTAFALEGDKEKMLDVGCNDYIPKPINMELLSAKIRKYFTRS